MKRATFHIMEDAEKTIEEMDLETVEQWLDEFELLAEIASRSQAQADAFGLTDANW